MFRRFIPALLILVCFILDTTLLPIVYGGLYAVPLTLVAVFSIGMVLGRMRGLLYGTLGGLLLDITSGTLGMMTFFFMITGFLIGLIVYDPSEHVVASRRKRRRRLLWRFSWIFSLFAAGEIAIFIYQYFHTATFEIIYVLSILLRSAIFTAITLALYPAMNHLLIGRGPRRAAPRNREVKSF